MSSAGMLGLSDTEVAAFVRDGVVRIDGAFPRSVADACRAVLWRDTGVDPDDAATWTKPVGDYSPIEQAIRLALDMERA